MERSTGSLEMLEQLMCPAFLVKDGTIIHANSAALQRQIPLNTAVTELISIGAEEYAGYTHGKLCLTLQVCDVTYDASVTAAEDFHVFCLDSDYKAPELRAFALAAQQLRAPLTNAMSGTEQLLQGSAIQGDEETKAQLAQINRGLHQLLRTVSNMSDAVHYTSESAFRMQTQDAVWVFDEVLQKAAALSAQADRKLEYSVPNLSVACLIDREKLERAVLNLVSNALKYASKDGIIKAELTYRTNRLSFTVENDDLHTGDLDRSNFFSRFLREPGIEDGRNGIGLGMSIVRSVASMHGGTVLMECPDDSRIRLTMTIAVRKSTENVFRSPVLLPVDYAGGFDPAILELSDALPPSMFDGNM